MINIKKAKEMKELSEKGYSYSQIGSAFGVTKGRVYQLLKALKEQS